MWLLCHYSILPKFRVGLTIPASTLLGPRPRLNRAKAYKIELNFAPSLPRSIPLRVFEHTQFPAPSHSPKKTYRKNLKGKSPKLSSPPTTESVFILRDSIKIPPFRPSPNYLLLSISFMISVIHIPQRLARSPPVP